MKPGALQFRFLCPEWAETHLRAVSISKKIFRLAIARHEGRESKCRRGEAGGKGTGRVRGNCSIAVRGDIHPLDAMMCISTSH
jgi:hypothetical protein